jgi:hypothetical protein
MAAYQGIFMDVAGALRKLGVVHGEGDWQGRWDERNWMNIPGPVYCAAGDNCGTGPLKAPNNVGVDADGYEVIFRQPVNWFEVRQVVGAAWSDPFNGYAADGNDHWTLSSIREWWSTRRRLESEVNRLYERELARGDSKNYHEFAGFSRWLDYLKDESRIYLRAYAFFLEEGREPLDDDLLPDV